MAHGIVLNTGLMSFMTILSLKNNIINHPLGMLDNRKIDFRQFFSLSFPFVHSRLSNFNTNDTGQSGEAAHVAH